MHFPSYNKLQWAKHLLLFPFVSFVLWCITARHTKTQGRKQKEEKNLFRESLLLSGILFWMLWHPIKSLKHACCIFNCHFKCQNPEVLLILYVNSVCLCSNPQALKITLLYTENVVHFVFTVSACVEGAIMSWEHKCMFITKERDHSWNLPEPWIIFQQWHEAKEQLISLFNLQELQLEQHTHDSLM